MGEFILLQYVFWPELEELANFTPEWTLICVPSFSSIRKPTEHVKVIL
jgi:hypothetical protein